MKLKSILTLAGAVALLAGAGLAQGREPPVPDHEAGVPLSPAEAAGGWTVENDGRNICMITLTADYGAAPSPNCAGALPAGITHWRPMAGGMALTDGSGQVLVPFNRWSNSLFASYPSSGTNVQLMRGPPID